MDKIEPFRTITSWQELIQLEQKFADCGEEWVFRGEAEHRPPKTTLQRACEQFGIEKQDIPQLERVLLKEFQRIYPLYSGGEVPEADDTIYWLSLMRHFGAPTRMLDFSFSMLIASFFALEAPRATAARGGYEPAAVWAISKTWLTKHSQRQMREIGGPELLKDWQKRLGSAFEKIFWGEEPRKIVVPVNPLRLHERLHVQQGLFLCPGDVSIGFVENLLALEGWRRGVRLFLIDDCCRPEVLWKLGQAGTSRESLFPGLQGFAESLRVAGPLLFNQYKRLEASGGRIPTDASNEFQNEKFDEGIPE